MHAYERPPRRVARVVLRNTVHLLQLTIYGTVSRAGLLLLSRKGASAQLQRCSWRPTSRSAGLCTTSATARLARKHAAACYGLRKGAFGAEQGHTGLLLARAQRLHCQLLRARAPRTGSTLGGAHQWPGELWAVDQSGTVPATAKHLCQVLLQSRPLSIKEHSREGTAGKRFAGGAP